MSTLRRFYVYTVALLALEAGLWSLDRLVVKAIRGVHGARLAMPIAGFVVGAAVFALHWFWAQSAAKRSEEENCSLARLGGIYLALLLTWGGVFHAAAGVLGKSVAIYARQRDFAFMFSNSTWTALLVALVLNFLAALYFESVRRTISLDDLGLQVQLAYRYTWISYAVGWVVVGSTRLLNALLHQGSFYNPAPDLLRGVVLAVLGLAVLAIWGWRWWRETLQSKALSGSAIFIAFALGGALSGLAVGLVAITAGIEGVLSYWLAQPVSSALYAALRYAVSVGVPWITLWLLAQYALRRALEGQDERLRIGVYRLELAILAFAGLATLSAGVSSLLSYSANALWGLSAAKRSLSVGIAMAVVGVPLWGIPWAAMRREMASFADASRSLTYRVYLYAVVFFAVLGGMIFGTVALYRLLLLVLGVHVWRFAPFAYALGMLLWSGGVLLAHARILHAFRRAEAKLLKEEFRALVLGDSAPWLEPLLAECELNLTAVTPHDAPPQAEFAAVVVDGAALANLPPEWRSWLSQHRGARLVVPPVAGDWMWFGAMKSPQAQARRVRDALRSLAEGRKPRLEPLTVWWKVFAYIGILAVLFTVFQMLIGIIAALSLISKAGI